jgi:hypothetical protein
MSKTRPLLTHRQQSSPDDSVVVRAMLSFGEPVQPGTRGAVHDDLRSWSVRCHLRWPCAVLSFGEPPTSPQISFPVGEPTALVGKAGLSRYGDVGTSASELRRS